MSPDARQRRRTVRRLLLLAHLVTGLGWIGVDAVLATLAVVGLTSDDPSRVAACYVALGTVVVPLLLAFGAGTLASGVLLALRSRWGLVRYWWVTAKLAITVTLTALVLLLLQPRVSEAALQAQRIDSTLTERLGHLQADLLFPGIVSGAALLVAAWLGVFTPGGRTPWARDGASRVRSTRPRQPVSSQPGRPGRSGQQAQPDR